MKTKTKKIVSAVSIGCLCIVLGIGLYLNNIISAGFNIDKPVYIYINQDKNYNTIISDLQSVAKIENINAFKTIASAYKYPNNMKSGRYEITPDMNVREVVDMLKSGHQKAVNVTFNNMRTKENLTERLSSQLMFSDEELLTALNDSAMCASLGFTTETITSMFIPNTYQIYWDTNVGKFLNRMKSEYSKFWNNSRLEKAKKQGLTPIESSILASIVEEECSYSDEYPMVAGLYLNRLRKGQMLQADPTVKFALGDFSLRRILFEHLRVESPYNTYLHTGLPPSAIRIPSIKAIDATLNPSEHNYIYMCAKEDFSGRHNFAVTLAEHERNATKYRIALNQRKIYK